MNSPVNDLLSNNIERVRNVCLGLRDLVLETVSEVDERVHADAKNISYHMGRGKEPFCAIAPCRSHVNLYFPRGVDIEDPKQLLDGTRETTRHIKIRTVTDIKPHVLASLIAAAAALDSAEDAEPQPPEERVPEAEGAADLPGPPKGDTTTA